MPPTPFECVAQWRTLHEEMMAAIQEWRLQPPKATPPEMAMAMDARLAELRARICEDVALASPAAEVSQSSPRERPVCSRCGTPGEPRGPRERQVTTHQGKTWRLRRSDVRGPACQVGVFPPR